MELQKKSWLPWWFGGFMVCALIVSSAPALSESVKEECYIEGQLCVPIKPRRTDYIKDELLLIYPEGVSKEFVDDILKKYNLDIKNSSVLDALKSVMLTTDTNGQDPLDLKLKIERAVEEIEAATNNIYSTATISEREFDQLDDKYPISMTHADVARKYSRGNGVLIGMIDTPVDHNHTSLKGRIERKDLVTIIPESAAQMMHGTLVAGVIVSQNPRIGIAPDARLYAISAFNVDPKKPGKFVSKSSLVAKAINLAIKRKVRILNLSFSGGHDALVEKMINKALSAGITVVAAGGNNGKKGEPAYPAALAGVMAVTAVDRLKKPYEFANQGRYIDLAAPGVGILTTAPGGRFKLASGTSLSAAHVSGAIALLMAKQQSVGHNILNYTARDLGEPGRDNIYGLGLIDVMKAMSQVLN
jgi:subtilisin family serine protease